MDRRTGAKQYRITIDPESRLPTEIQVIVTSDLNGTSNERFCSKTVYQMSNFGGVEAFDIPPAAMRHLQ